MAKGNLFLGTASRSVGDVTFYTRGGVQVSRKRVRQISNPRSVAQSSQRSTFAPASKFYSPLAEVLATSFEGLNRSRSLSAFLKHAVTDGRYNGWFVPRGTGFFPVPFQLSSGTIQPMNYSAGVDGIAFTVPDTVQGGDVVTMGDVSKLFLSLGYSVGDQITVIMVLAGSSETSFEPSFWPVTSRFLLEPDSTVLAADALPLFEVSNEAPDVLITTRQGFDMVAGALIVSRYEGNKWRRSTQRLGVADWVRELLTDGANKDASIASYMQSTAVVQSDIYLNGSTGGVDGGVQSIVLDDGTAFSPRNIQYSNGLAEVGGTTGAGAFTYVNVKIGADYLITANSKGAAPQGVRLMSHTIDGANSAVKNWLQTNGVASSVF